MPLRQGFPGPLLRLPLFNGIVAENTSESIDWLKCLNTIHSVLRKYLVHDYSVSLANRIPPEHRPPLFDVVSHNQNLTCLIITQRDVETNSWSLALKELEELYNIGSIGGFTIELIDPELFQPEWPQPLGEDEAVIAFWPEIRTETMISLDKFDWYTLSLVRWGRSVNALENPITILIGAPAVTDETRDSVTNTIRKTLDRFFLDDIEIALIAATHPFSSPDQPTDLILPTSAFQPSIAMGSSFGPRDVDTSATMGGTIRLHDSDGNHQDAMMSVFHCFRTVVGNEIESQGLRPTPNSQFQSMIPSGPDRQNKLQNLEENIKSYSGMIEGLQQKMDWTGDSRYQKQIDVITNIVKTCQEEKDTIEQFDSTAGSLWACSGFQTEHLHDWSLSLARNRTSPNTLPPLGHGELSVPPDHEIYLPPIDPEVKSYLSQIPKTGSIVWKKGRTTGITMGKMNSVRANIVLKDNQNRKHVFTGWEITPMKRNVPFVQPGDSGAWVLDLEGNWCGVVFAQLASGSGVMYDAKSVVKDIERMTRCKVELP